MPEIPTPPSPPSSTPELTDAEWNQCVDFAKQFYEILAEFVPGDTTVNELRILTAVAVASATEEGTSVSEIAETYGISKGTVSRLITTWMAAGRISESPHPKDGRRRILSFSDEARRFSRHWAQRLATILPMDPSSNSPDKP